MAAAKRPTISATKKTAKATTAKVKTEVPRTFTVTLSHEKDSTNCRVYGKTGAIKAPLYIAKEMFGDEEPESIEIIVKF